jgi:hypothetical protein
MVAKALAFLAAALVALLQGLALAQDNPATAERPVWPPAGST